jgi:hypothetical protein
MEFTSAEYYTDCSEYAKEIIQEVISEDLESLVDNDFDDYDFNDRLLETVDGSQYAIYNYYHLQILASSGNAEYGADNGLMGTFGDYDNFSAICAAMCFWAVYADIQEYITKELFEEIKAELLKTE